MSIPRIAIIGAGLSGLACARKLSSSGLEVRVFEASDDVGGRVRTDEVEGFLLDRGFQILLDSYEHAREILDFDELKLYPFEAGAMIRKNGRFQTLADPLRRPASLFKTLRATAGHLGDATRMLSFRRHARSRARGLPKDDGGRDALSELRQRGFSEAMIEEFFRPFFGGVFLEGKLESAASSLLFLFDRFSRGHATLPAKGMQAIPRQLADGLPNDVIQLRTPVSAVDASGLTTADGQRQDFDAVVIATDPSTADRLLGRNEKRDFNGTTCLYFAAPSSPVDGAWLVLDGEDSGPVNHLCVPSEVAPGYAPDGQALISASVLGCDHEAEGLEAAVRAQLGAWFGASVNQWRLLRSERIPEALPTSRAGAFAPEAEGFAEVRGLFVCGDHVNHPSIEGALLSGSRCAEAVRKRMSANAQA